MAKLSSLYPLQLAHFKNSIKIETVSANYYEN